MTKEVQQPPQPNAISQVEGDDEESIILSEEDIPPSSGTLNSTIVSTENLQSTNDDPNDTSATLSASPSKGANEKVTWGSMPHKDQLLILTLARLAEPITSTSLQSYLYHQVARYDYYYYYYCYLFF
jgi:hypothetical protein